MKVLLIEDDSRIASFIRRGLTAQGYVVSTCSDGREGLELGLAEEFDIVILDLNLPTFSGEQVLERLRAAGRTVPVIVLTAKDAISDRVRNLEAGADDYLVKPFSFSELLARMRVRLRPAAGVAPTVLTCGDVALDLRSREVQIDGDVHDLTAREFALMEMFLRHPNQVLSQAQLLDRVWGYEYDPGSNIVEVYVGYLRRKVGAGLIETVRGAGYRLRAG